MPAPAVMVDAIDPRYPDCDGNSAVIEKGQVMSFAEICAFLLVLLAFGTFVLKVVEARRDK